MIRRSLPPATRCCRNDVLRPATAASWPPCWRRTCARSRSAVDAVSGTAGLIWPGDRVDLILTQQMHDEAARRAYRRVAGETVLTDVRVIAVDQALMQGAVGRRAGALSRQARTVTLEVTAAAGGARLGRRPGSGACRCVAPLGLGDAGRRDGRDVPRTAPPSPGRGESSKPSASAEAAGHAPGRNGPAGRADLPGRAASARSSASDAQLDPLWPPAGPALALPAAAQPLVPAPAPMPPGARPAAVAPGTPVPMRPADRAQRGSAAPACGLRGRGRAPAASCRSAAPRPASSPPIPRVVEVRPASPTSLFVFGVAPGRTTVAALDAAGPPVAQYEVTVRPSAFGAAEAQSPSPACCPGSASAPSRAATVSPCSGEAPTPADAERAVAIARGYVTEGQAVDNRLRVLGQVQVNLRVRIAEVSREVTRQLGVDWQASAPSAASPLLADTRERDRRRARPLQPARAAAIVAALPTSTPSSTRWRRTG